MERARRELLVIIILVVAVIAAGFLLLSDQRAPSSTSKCTPGESSLATVLGTLTVPSGGSTGNLTMTVENSTCSSITGIMVTAAQPTLAGVVNSTFVEYYGTPVSASNALPVGQGAAGQLHVTGIAAGQQYRLTVKVTFSSGAAARF